MVTKQRTNRDNSLANLRPFQPGQSGNLAGRPRNSVTTILKETDEHTNEQIAKKIIELALRGDLPAIREYLDRTDGKVAEKHLSLNLTVTPEYLEEAQKRLSEALGGTQELISIYKEGQKAIVEGE